MDTFSAISFLASLNEPMFRQGAAYGFDGGIERTSQLMNLLECTPKPGFVVTVTGSKGKGSSSCMLASILQASGYKVGLFTGPHLYDYRERIRISGRMISPEEFTGYIEKIKTIIDSDEKDPAIFKTPTTFECLTAIAAKYFGENDVDYSILEVGIGGRLDAVNAIDADVSVFTNISLEHTETLGTSVAAIATEKLGIARPDSIVVTADQPEAAMEVIERYCKNNRIKLIRIDKEWISSPLQSNVKAPKVGQTFSLKKRETTHADGILDAYFSRPQRLFVPLLGEHQITNATLAIATLNHLPAARTKVNLTSVQRGLANVTWPGRLEIVGRDPLVVVDGAHNPDSAQKLIKALKTTFRYKKLIIVIGIVYSKDIAGILKEIAPYADELVVVRFAHRRAAPPEDIVSQLGPIEHSGRVTSFPTVQDGLTFATSVAAPTDLICVTGSTYLVAQARKTFLPNE